MSRARRYGAWLLPWLVLLGVSRALVPAAPLRVASDPGHAWSGVLHVHTSRSDGSGSPAEVAAAAAAAGLDFVILGDHGDGSREPSAPAYLSGVLVIDGVEISTEAGHYLAIGMRRAPYPLAGDAAAVAEDVARLGGIGLLAHPDSSRTALAWHAPEVRGDGIELLNADSAWRDESVAGLLARLVPYPWRPASVLATTLTYPAAQLASLDTPDAAAPRLAVAGVDAHARIGLRPRDEPVSGGWILARWPSYRASFGTFGMVVPWTRGRAPTGNAVEDARAVVDALQTHRAHIALFALGDAVPLRFTAVSRGAVHQPGARLDSGEPVTLVVEAPPVGGAYVRLLRNGQPWREAAPGDRLVAEIAAGDTPTVYRAEAWLPARWRQPRLPWLVSQAIAVDLPAPAPLAGADRGGADGGGPDVGRGGDGTADEVPVSGPWQVEHDRCSAIDVAPADGGGVRATVQLCDGPRVSQFAAASVAWPDAAAGATDVAFVGSADRPMRISVQVRQPEAGDGRRWTQSVYLDGSPRPVAIRLDDMRPVTPATGTPPTDRLHALLFVVDTVNTAPGTRATFRLDDLRLRVRPLQ